MVDRTTMSRGSRTPPPPQVGALLRMAWQELQANLAAALVAAGYDDLRPGHLPLLRDMLVEPLRPSELAAQIGLSKQAMNDVLREFESKGYITLEPDPDDRRAKRIHATERGWGLALTGSRLSRDIGR